MKLKEVLDKTVTFFKDKKIETARLDTEIILAHALGLKNRIDIYLKFDNPLTEPELAKCRDLVRRRVQGEPVAYITGQKEFFGISFIVNPSVLIPRPETEHLVEAALEWIKKNNIENPRVLDLGCGSGCIGQTIAKKIPTAKIAQVDISAEALEVAKQNAEKNSVIEQIEFVLSDAMTLNLSEQKFDLVLANPPYIAETDEDIQPEVKKFEPAQALFANDNGEYALKEWSKKFASNLSNKGIMIFELGSKQGQNMKSHFESLSAFGAVYLIKDLSGLDRHIVGEKNG